MGEQEAADLPTLKIVSFNRYCRARAVRRRLGSRINSYTTHPLFEAIGGMSPCYRVLFCRTTVTDRVLAKLWRRTYHGDSKPSSITTAIDTLPEVKDEEKSSGR